MHGKPRTKRRLKAAPSPQSPPPAPVPAPALGLGSDRIEVCGLVVRTRIGVFEEERVHKQEVVIDLTLHTDIARAAASDAIADAVDYKAVTKTVISFVEGATFRLVEALADSIARLLIAQFDFPAVTVRVAKPGALRYAASVAIAITRRR